MKTAAYVSGLLGLMLIAYNVVDRIEQHTEARLAMAEAYQEGCLPRPGETAVITSDGRHARCIVYSTASLGTGMAPKLISAAAVEVRP